MVPPPPPPQRRVNTPRHRLCTLIEIHISGCVVSGGGAFKCMKQKRGKAKRENGPRRCARGGISKCEKRNKRATSVCVSGCVMWYISEVNIITATFLRIRRRIMPKLIVIVVQPHSENLSLGFMKLNFYKLYLIYTVSLWVPLHRFSSWYWVKTNKQTNKNKTLACFL